ncbi:MAG: WD40 repeat domain-containing protein [Gemmataceae bacterium]
MGRANQVLLALAAVFFLTPGPGLIGAETKPAPAREEPAGFQNEAKNLLGGNNDVWSVVFSPDGKLLISGDGYWDRPGGVSIWDAATRKRLQRFPETLGVTSVAVSPDGKRLASTS